MSHEFRNYNDAAYAAYVATIQARVNELSANYAHFFKTNPKNLFETYLGGFPDAESKQYHNCNTCKSFIRRYGSLVVIKDDGTTVSVMWNENDAPEEYKASVKAMRVRVEAERVTDVFITSEAKWGKHEAGGWMHLAVAAPLSKVVTKPREYRGSPAEYAAGQTGQRAQDYRNLSQALVKINVDHVQQVEALVNQGAFYRGDVLKPQIELVRKALLSMATSRIKNNVVRRIAAEAHTSLCSPLSGLLGSVLEDMGNGMLMETVKARFEEKVQPGRYQQATAAPSAGAVQVAEKLFADLGLGPSLPWSYARLSQIEKSWEPRQAPGIAPPAPSGVFSNVGTKGEPPTTSAPSFDMALPEKMTWAKFVQTVQPSALAIEAKVPMTEHRYMAITTMTTPEAPPLLRWDHESNRNPFCWYYAAGDDGGVMRERVLKAGGKFDDNDVRVTLMWNSHTDLDLHVMGPIDPRTRKREYVWYGLKQSASGGWLDVDMNVSPETLEPVENTRWARGKAPSGDYGAFVHCFTSRDRGGWTPYTLEIQTGQERAVFTGRIGRRANGQDQHKYAFSFDKSTGKGVIKTKSATPAAVSSSPAAGRWGLVPGSWVQVNAISSSPNLWQVHEGAYASAGRHVFFILDGCHDGDPSQSRGFFPSQLRPELHPVRAVIEAYAKNSPLSGSATADACGLGFNEGDWNLDLRVTTAAGMRYIRIDRRD